MESEQCFAIRSAKRVAVYRASLKLVRQEARAQPPNNDKNIQHPKDEKFTYMYSDTAIKMMH